MNIGLVLSGGMAKGAFQIGALKALEEFIPREEMKYISCASVGVLNSYAYATGNIEGGQKLWEGLCEDDKRLFITKVLKSDRLQDIIKSLYLPNEEITSDFYCTLLSLEDKSVVYKNFKQVDREKIAAYLKASVAMPIYNKAVTVDGQAYYDGATVDNIPVFPLLKHELDYVICIFFDDVCYKFENPHFDSKIIKITFPTESRLRQSLVFTRESVDKMISEGYERAQKVLSDVFAKGKEDLDYIYSAAQRYSGKDKSLRVTGDVLITNLNKVTAKIAKKKIVL